MKTIITVLCLMMICAVAHAQESTVESQMMADETVSMIEPPSTTCTKGDLTRTVEITYAGEQGKAPCEVHYKKVIEGSTQDQIIYDAQHKNGYCEEKKRAFVAKLLNWGWDCK